MKTRKFNLLIQIAILCLCVTAIAIGVYSAKTASLNVSGTIGFSAHDCEVYVLARVSGGVNENMESVTPMYCEGEGDFKKIKDENNVFNLGSLYFDDLNVTDTSKIANDINLIIYMYNASAFPVEATIDIGQNSQTGVVSRVKNDKDSVVMPANQTSASDNQVLRVVFELESETSLTSQNINISVNFKKSDLLTVNMTSKDCDADVSFKVNDAAIWSKNLQASNTKSVSLGNMSQQIPTSNTSLSVEVTNPTDTLMVASLDYEELDFVNVEIDTDNSSFFAFIAPGKVGTLSYNVKSTSPTNSYIAGKLNLTVEDVTAKPCTATLLSTSTGGDMLLDIDGWKVFGSGDAVSIEKFKAPTSGQKSVTVPSYFYITKILNPDGSVAEEIPEGQGVPIPINYIGMGTFANLWGEGDTTTPIDMNELSESACQYEEINISNGISGCVYLNGYDLSDLNDFNGDITTCPLLDSATNVKKINLPSSMSLLMATLNGFKNLKGIHLPIALSTVNGILNTGLDDISVSSGCKSFMVADDCLLSVSGSNISLTHATKSVSYIPSIVNYELEDYCFEGCLSITSLQIPENIRVNEKALSGLKNLKRIEILDNTNLHANSFKDLTNLEYLKIGNISWYNSDKGKYFQDCKNLKTVEITATANYLTSSYFLGLPLESIVIDSNNPTYSDYGTNVIVNKSTKELIAGFKNSTIPDEVTSISSYAFANCDLLTSITIPNSVTKIGGNAFENCTGLKSVIISNKITEIDYATFRNCTSLTSIDIPEGVTIIDIGAFYNCTSLTSVTIPSTVTKIEREVFDYCDITSIVISDANKNYSSKANGVQVNAILNKDSTTLINGFASTTIPASVIKIVGNAFVGRSKLKSITIPEGVETIEMHAFIDCENLSYISIPSSATKIGVESYSSTSTRNIVVGSSNISKIDIASGNPKFSAVSNGIQVNAILNKEGNCLLFGFSSTVIPNGTKITEIASHAFSGAKFTSFNIPEGITSIGECAFWRCANLKSIILPASLKEMGGSETFYGCTSLTSITIPNSVTSIGYEAFFGCTSLTSITIPNSVTSIGNGAFHNCTSLTSITIPNSVTRIESDTFYGCSSLSSVIIPSTIITISIYAFDNTPFLKNLQSNSNGIYTTSDSKKIMISAPSECTSIDLTGVYLIAGGAFSGCTNLTSITIPNSVTSIGGGAFQNCSSLTSITIPNSVTSIGNSTFSGCTGLTSITIPNSVTSIGNSAFNGCTGLTSITIPNTITSIGDNAFKGCTGLTSITIPNSVTSIGDEAFNDCTGLTSITIPNSVTSIGDRAFYGCTSLTSIAIPDTVTSIGRYTFYGCTSLSSVIMPSTISEISWGAFTNTPFLKNLQSKSNGIYTTSDGKKIMVKAPSGCTSIDLTGVYLIASEAFQNCTSLTSITIPSSVTGIGYDVFYGCTGLKSITINDLISNPNMFWENKNIETIKVNSQNPYIYYFDDLTDNGYTKSSTTVEENGISYWVYTKKA